MIAVLKIPAKHLINRWMLLLFTFYGIVLLVALRNFVLWQSVNFLLGLLAIVVSTQINKENKVSQRFFYASVALALLSVALPVKTILFFALAFAVFFVIETFYGRLNLLPVIILGMMSPFFQYVTNIFSFPIRLYLTTCAGKLLNAAGIEATVHGNMIYYNGSEFSVDPACMGLNMLVTSLLLGVMIIAIYQKKYQRTLNIWQVGLLLVTIVLFNMLANLFRIVFVVQFNILPGAFMHDVMGIICLAVYVIIPYLFITKFVIRRFGKNNVQARSSQFLPAPEKWLVMHVMVVCSILLSAFSIVKRDNAMGDSSKSVLPVSGYTTQRVSADIIKLENEKSLVYIKSIEGFYSADHNPSICWKGSGYSFKQVQEENIQGSKFYTAVLENENGKLYTAWWYDNGQNRTSDQLNWRWDALNGGNAYAVINVTCANKQQLEKEIRHIVLSNCLRPLLQYKPFNCFKIYQHDNETFFWRHWLISTACFGMYYSCKTDWSYSSIIKSKPLGRFNNKLT